jgi:hypothetical protein
MRRADCRRNAAVLGSRASGCRAKFGVVVLFCGSHKSLTGIDRERAVPEALHGSLLLPLMIYHQLELMVGASLAGRYAIRGPLTPDRDDRGTRRRPRSADGHPRNTTHEYASIPPSLARATNSGSQFSPRTCFAISTTM